MQYTLRNYTKRTFTQQELLDLQDKGVRFSDDEPSFCPDWSFNSDSEDFYAVSESSMQLFLSLVEGSKKEAAEDSTEQFPAFVPLTEMQLKVVGSAYMQWDADQEFTDFLKHNQEHIHNWFIELMKEEQEAAEKAVKEAEEARRKAEEEKDWVTVGEGGTFEYDETKFVFLQISPGVFKVFDLHQSTGLPGNRYTDKEFTRGQRVKISSII